MYAKYPKFTQVETYLKCYWYYTQIQNLPTVLHNAVISLGEKRLEWVTDHSSPSNAKTLHYMPSWNYRDHNVTLTLNYIPPTGQPFYNLTNLPSSYTEVICSQITLIILISNICIVHLHILNRKKTFITAFKYEPIYY